jgi:hypothetical protein
MLLKCRECSPVGANRSLESSGISISGCLVVNRICTLAESVIAESILKEVCFVEI